ncbi:hypothetical protein JOM56_010403 [Amanita muscaria]
MDWLSLLPTFLFLSVVFISTFSYLSSPDASNSAKPKVVEAPPRYLAEFKVRALTRRRERRKIKPIPFMIVPDEIKIKILSHTSERGSIEALRALLRVSKRIRYMTLQSCLPLLPIVLHSRRNIQSFYLFCLSNPELVRCVHHIWVQPPSQEDQFPACAIIKACTNLRTLACTASMLGAAVCSEGTLRHEHCRDFTLLESPEVDWESTLPKRVASAFFGSLTHLRVVGKVIPSTLQCREIIHSSCMCTLEEWEGSLVEVGGEGKNRRPGQGRS